MRGLFFGGAVAGVLIGFGLGLATALFFWPVPPLGGDPADLRLDLKDDYLRMIASSYSLDGDMARALGRLASLRLAHPDASVSELARREPNPLYQQLLIHFALDLAQPSVALARPTFTPRPTKTSPAVQVLRTVLPAATPTPTRAALPFPTTLLPDTAIPEPTALPATSQPDPGATLYLLKSKRELNCLETRGRGLIQVDVQSADAQPQPGVAVEVNWKTGDQIMYTGLKPERGMGYADIEVEPGFYNVRLTEGARSDVVENLRIDDEPVECTFDSTGLRGWKLVFEKGS